MVDSFCSEDDALLFFREMVEPTVAEFMADRADKRRGCLACLTLACMTEHYIHARLRDSEKDLTAFKRALYEENKVLRYIADVANATRHVKRFPRFDAIGFEDIQAMEMGQIGILQCGWPIGGEEVLVGPKHEWRLSQLIEWTMGFWRDKLGLGAEG